MGPVDFQIQADMAVSQGRQAAAQGKVNARGDEEAMRRAAKEFEAVLLSQMLRPMFEGTDVEEPFGGGKTEQIWKSMLIDEYGKSMAAGGGIGLADAVMREMIMMQEANQK